MSAQDFYQPTGRGFEAKVAERLEYWRERRQHLQHNADGTD